MRTINNNYIYHRVTKFGYQITTWHFVFTESLLLDTRTEALKFVRHVCSEHKMIFLVFDVTFFGSNHLAYRIKCKIYLLYLGLIKSKTKHNVSNPQKSFFLTAPFSLLVFLIVYPTVKILFNYTYVNFEFLHPPPPQTLHTHILIKNENFH